MPRGLRRLPPECLRRLEAADVILHAGDFVRLSVLEELRGLAPVEGVAGNMDERELREVLPERRIVDVAGVRVGMVHDPGRPRAGRSDSSTASPTVRSSSTATRTFPRPRR